MNFKTTIFFCFLCVTSYSQKSLSVGLRTGFIFYDLINQKQDTDDRINGYGSQADLFIEYQYRLRKLNLINSIGYTRLDNFENNFFLTRIRNPTRNRLFSNYLNTSIGARFPLKNKHVLFGSNLIFYFLAHKDRINFTERRVFANIDLSLSFVFKKIEINLSTPITLLPVYRENTLKSSYLSHAGEFVQINSFVEMIGFNVGCKIKIFDL